jgi:hypothetical protein
MVLPLDVALGVGVAVGDVPLLYQHSLEYPNAGSLLATPPTEQLTPLVKGPLTLYIAEGAFGGNAPNTTVAVPVNEQASFSLAQ